MLMRADINQCYQKRAMAVQYCEHERSSVSGQVRHFTPVNQKSKKFKSDTPATFASRAAGKACDRVVEGLGVES